MMSVVSTEIDLTYEMQNYSSVGTTFNVKKRVPKEHK